MSWVLFRKDLRLLRIPFIAGFVLTAVVYGITTLVAFGITNEPYWDDDLTWIGREGTAEPPRQVSRKEMLPSAIVERAVLPGAFIGLGLTAVMAVVFGGMTFAAERRDRSAQFLGMLPVPRLRIAASKLLAVLACLAIPVAIHLAVLAFSPNAIHVGRAILMQYFPLAGRGANVLHFVGIGVMLFGVAWALSAVLDSPALATAIAVGVVTTVLYLVALAGWRVDAQKGLYSNYAPRWDAAGYVLAPIAPYHLQSVPDWVMQWTRITTLGTGAAGLLVGTVVYVRRVAP